MNELKLKLFKYMTNEQKTFLLLGIQNINQYKLISSHNKNFVLTGGNNNMEEYENIYDNKSGKYNIDIDGNKYYYRIERYSPDKEFRIIDLITIKDKYKNTVHCGSIQIDRKEKIANIISLGNSNKCLKSTEGTEFKYGDIIFQIIIHICKKENIKKIELTDNSNITCSKYNLNLNYLKTITHGLPHYIKYGFVFENIDNNLILNENYENYKTNPKINKIKLINIIKNNGDKKIITHLIDIINKFTDDTISIKKFILLLMRDLDNNEYCELVNNIYIQLYKYAQYKPYFTSKYELLI